MGFSNDPILSECEGCPGCSVAGRNPQPGRSPVAEDAPTLTGWRLAGASAALFLFPILTAAIGAGLAGSAGPAQLAGGGLGLAAGIATARLTTRGLQRTTEVGP